MSEPRMSAATWAGIGTALSCGLIAAVGIAINAPLFALTLDDTGMTPTEERAIRSATTVPAIFNTDRMVGEYFKTGYLPAFGGVKD